MPWPNRVNPFGEFEAVPERGLLFGNRGSLLNAKREFVRRFQPDATPETLCHWIDAGNGAVKQRFWTLDPIDGTKGFLRNDQYAVALALIEDGEVKVGALACPALPFKLDDPASPTNSL